MHCFLLNGILLLGTKSFCLAEEQKIIDEDCSADSSDGYATSEEEKEEMRGRPDVQGNKDTLEEQEAGKQDNGGSEKSKTKQKPKKVNN